MVSLGSRRVSRSARCMVAVLSRVVLVRPLHRRATVQDPILVTSTGEALPKRLCSPDVTPNARLPLVALAAFMAFAGIDLAWPVTPAAPLEHVDDCSCIDCDDDGPDAVLLNLDVEEDG